MPKMIGISTLPRGLQGFVDEVAQNKTQIVLTRQQQPQAAIIPYEDFLHYQEMRESESLMHFHEMRARHARLGTQLGDE